ncbi:hypothetical protein KMW28_09035 [Flammeovirga yaeyamensis]|uniref:Uncharacterized protein n=1 Tax=Flammeovirga yaeyamensis TaxID=367791 RepID=A0AAX1NDG1_9BACT|nr:MULTISPECIES: hypothetical protein [Flammeovirga]ANQ48810.2 hypothetical protein MY04_1434 [Flammeovirga sp. MY04]MBB3698891.1 biotin operon repressor [Flammeovirga yaeyamensis]NMF36326.1 hypothetical protein [Flammeovirga yaeyamensis]QWG03713.1 hypothetical protein KMW28_09035 [Flammeovirga yaeyamensis]
MSIELRSSKLLVALCLNKGKSMQQISKLLGLSLCSYDLNKIVEKLKAEGMLTNVDVSPKGIFAEPTDLAMERVDTLAA